MINLVSLYRSLHSPDRVLLENGADIEAFAKHPHPHINYLIIKTNPLHLAIKNERVEIAKFLLDKGANIEAPDHHKNTAIFHAIHTKSLEMVKELIERGANFKALNRSFSTPLIHSVGKV